MAKRKQQTRRRGKKRSRVTRQNKTSANSMAVKKRVTDVIKIIRKRGESLNSASRRIGTSPRTVVRHAGAALQKNAQGRYSAKASDRIERSLLIPTPTGPNKITVRNSRDASRLGSYWSALHKYYETGDKSIRKFAGKSIADTNGVKFPLITDLDTLDRLGSAGVVSFESIYDWSAN